VDGVLRAGPTLGLTLTPSDAPTPDFQALIGTPAPVPPIVPTSQASQ
jgi:hypothetical protein